MSVRSLTLLLASLALVVAAHQDFEQRRPAVEDLANELLVGQTVGACELGGSGGTCPQNVSVRRGHVSLQ